MWKYRRSVSAPPDVNRQHNAPAPAEVERKQRYTIFKYKCLSCAAVDLLDEHGSAAHCQHCGASYPISPSGVIRFIGVETEQTQYFDELYAQGRSHARDEADQHYAGPYTDAVKRCEAYLKACDLDLASGVSNLSILDVACGSGWVSAGLVQHPSVRDCKLHAFDISAEGTELLARFARTFFSTNHLEISVQNADRMVFADSSFNLIIGSSVLHHFDEFEDFLTHCRSLLMPGGIAVFGEPFALGYGIAGAALRAAQDILGRRHKAIDAFYTDLAFRLRNPRELLRPLVDKHLFFESIVERVARHIGFAEVKFVPWASREYYRDRFIDDLLSERGVSDEELAAQAKSIYRASFDLFDADSYVHSIAEFIYVVLYA
jgi:SAM-dependent methyltransferase